MEDLRGWEWTGMGRGGGGGEVGGHLVFSEKNISSFPYFFVFIMRNHNLY